MNPDPQTLDDLVQVFLNSDPSIPRSDRTTSELEVKFGTMGVRPITRLDYDNVINELYNHGFSSANATGRTFMRIQNEYLDPHTGRTKMSNVRCEISSIEAIQQYCKSNSLSSIPGHALTFEQKMAVQRSDRSSYRPANNKEFNFRTSLQYEKILSPQSNMIRDLVSDWSNKKKLFRFINRVSFTHDTYPISVDLSIVKSSRRESERMIPEYTIEASRVFDDVENYEIELEIINSKTGSGTPWTKDMPQEFVVMLKSNIKIILSGLQQTHYPISYPEQDSILQSYMGLVVGADYAPRKVVPKDFIGPSSTTLQIE